MLRLFWKIITGKIYWMLPINILSMFVVLYLMKGQWEWGQKKLLSPYVHHTLLMWFFNLPKTSSFARQKFQNSETLICVALALSSLFGKKKKNRRLNCYSSSDGLMKGAVFAIVIKQQRKALSSHGCILSPVTCKIQYDGEKNLRISRVYL